MQRKAVEKTETPLLVLAGAGSGKTKVLTYRIAYLLAKGAEPQNILAITFTNKAANEMKERVQKIVGVKAKDLWLGTFHSICVRILRREIGFLNSGYDSHFTIYDELDQQNLVKTCLKELNLDDKKFQPKTILNHIGQAKNNIISPEDYQKKAETFFEETMSKIYKLYQEKLLAQNAMDFDDLITNTVLLFLNSSETLKRYQEDFRYILVDEYQDTDHAQYILINLLAQKWRNLCVVGDPDQSIYSWRGANVRNIFDFQKDYPEAVVVKLEQNYRSTETILKAANQVIANNSLRLEKRLWSNLGKGEPLKVSVAENEREEAVFIAEEAKHLVEEEGYAYNDIVILYRTHALSRVLEEELMKNAIPYNIYGGFRFYERKEIKDIISYLRVIVNPFDDQSLERIINVPRRGIGELTLVKLKTFARKNGISLYQTLNLSDEVEGLSKRFINIIKEFYSMLEELRKESQTKSIPDFVESVIEKSGYLKELKEENSLESEGRLENLKEFISAAKSFEKENPNAFLEDFLGQLSLISAQDAVDENVKKILLMTLHTAKGLEFPVVFIMAMEEGIFPHQRSLENEEQLEEERRLCYVGMTRAKRKLYLSYAKNRTLYGFSSYNKRSRFLDEISSELCCEIKKKRKTNSFSLTNNPEDKLKKIFEPGQKVHHPKFGAGVIVALRENEKDGIVEVAFAGQGIKKLDLKYAPLSKIE